MKFKFQILFLLIVQLTVFLNAQQLKLSYDVQFIKDTIRKEKEVQNMTLLADTENYIFCSENLLEKDSLKNNNLEYSTVIMDDEINFMVKRKNNIYTKFYIIDEKLYVLNENATNLNWQIKKDLKIIDGLTCQLATLSYKGRNWSAWFTSEYPISLGPYIFNGLPGLIVELKDSRNNFLFKLTKITKTNEDINRIINQSVWIEEKPITINKKQLIKLYLTEYNDPYRRMKEKKIIYMIDEKTGEHQPPPDFDKMTKNAQKHIRDNNNPIELADAIKYP